MLNNAHFHCLQTLMFAQSDRPVPSTKRTLKYRTVRSSHRFRHMSPIFARRLSGLVTTVKIVSMLDFSSHQSKALPSAPFWCREYRAGNIENFAAVIVGHGGIHRAVSFNVVSSASPPLTTTGATAHRRCPPRVFRRYGYSHHRVEGKWHIR